jgi:hypothetical protein
MCDIRRKCYTLGEPVRQVVRCQFPGGRDRPALQPRPDPPSDVEPSSEGGQPLSTLCIRLPSVIRFRSTTLFLTSFMNTQWWANYFYKVTALLYYRYWSKKLATFNPLSISPCNGCVTVTGYCFFKCD